MSNRSSPAKAPLGRLGSKEWHKGDFPPICSARCFTPSAINWPRLAAYKLILNIQPQLKWYYVPASSFCNSITLIRNACLQVGQRGAGLPTLKQFFSKKSLAREKSQLFQSIFYLFLEIEYKFILNLIVIL